MATRSAKIDQKADLIWAIADKLTGVYKPHEYGDVILPLTVIRRFDCILSDTKDAVLQKYDEVKNLPMKDILLRKASKKDFYNTSKYTFERLMDDTRCVSVIAVGSLWSGKRRSSLRKKRYQMSFFGWWIL